MIDGMAAVNKTAKAIAKAWRVGDTIRFDAGPGLFTRQRRDKTGQWQTVTINIGHGKHDAVIVAFTRDYAGPSVHVDVNGHRLILCAQWLALRTKAGAEKRDAQRLGSAKKDNTPNPA